MRQILLQSLLRLVRQIGLILWLLALAPLALLLAANTELGQRVLVWGVEELTDGRVRLEGLEGSLPAAPRLRRLELRDTLGTWLVMEDAALDLDPRALVRGEVVVGRLSAESLWIPRLPEGGGGAAPFSPPLRIRLDHLTIPDLRLGPASLGAPALVVHGHGAFGGRGPPEVGAEVRAQDRADRYGLELRADPDGLRLVLDLQEAAGGLLPALAVGQGWPLPADLGDWRLAVRAEGPYSALALDGTLSAGAARANAEGRLDLRTRSFSALRLELPDLAPLASLAGLDLGGGARLEASGTLEGEPRLEASGHIALTRAPAPLLGLLGPEARVSLAANREGDAWRLDRTEIEGAGIRVAARGRLGPAGLGLGWTLAVPDLASLGSGWSGRLRAQGGLVGPLRAPDLAADLHLEGASALLGAGQVEGRIGARLAGPAAAVHFAGDWAGQPLALDLEAGAGPDRGLRMGLREARWAGVSASGDLRLDAGSALPQGELRIDAEPLADLGPWLVALGIPADPGLDGRLGARLRLQGQEVRLDALGDGLALPGGVRITALALDAEVADPWGAAHAQGRLELSGLAQGAAAADLSLGVRGTLQDLALTADSRIATAAGPAHLQLGGRLDTAARRLTLERLAAQGWDQRLSLQDPAQVDLAAGLSVDRLRLGLGVGTLELAGRLLPPLATEARLAGLPLGLAAPLWPNLPLAGTLGGEARLGGPIEALAGSVRLKAEGVRLTQGAARGLPPAEVRLAADLTPTGVRIDASTQAGEGTRLGLRGGIGGRLPLAPGDLNLAVEGRLDLALLDPLLTGSGRQAAGQALLDARVTGDLTAPRLDGAVRLTNGAFWDRTLGLVLTQAQGRLALAGDTWVIEGLRAQAGTGSLALTGTVGALAPGIPLDLRLTAEDASPLQLDRLKVRGGGEVRLTGQALGRLEAGGALRLKQVEIRLPERLPAAVVTLDVREVGQRRAGEGPAPSGPGWRPDLGLDLLVSAPRSVEVRGRGVDAELGGEVRLQGTLADPVLSGGFDLRRGEYELVGQTLRFTRGRLGFDGATGLNPSLDLEARASAAGSTAILAVEGTAQAPRIALKGEPEMPQDEVLSRLLFGVAGGRLSPWQATRLGLAAASLAGINVEGPGLLDRVRKGLGLGDLRLGSDAEGGASLTGGRQVSERVYLGARQGSRAGEPQGVLRIEVSPRLRLEADVGPIGGTRAGAAFEIEY